MKKYLRRFESTMWLCIKGLLYLLLMTIFIWVMGKENIGLTRPSRTLGITVSTFVIVGMLFLSVYGKYDVGRRKSKPIMHSLWLAVICTDVITYLQNMIMKTTSNAITAFRLEDLGLLGLAIILQIIVIVIFVYGGNALFFKIHKPERCCIITSSQERLDELVASILKFKKQYQITKVLDYKSKHIEEEIKNSDTVFIYDVPSDIRTDIMRWSYKYKVNVYFNPEIEDIMEYNSTNYILNDVYLFNKNVKALTMEQRVMKRLLDIGLSLVLGILSLPIILGAMIAIKLDDGGPVFFKQERATINGTHFFVYKLRTMKQNVENHSVTKDDDRITKAGKFLRRTRIDELPQIFNVLKGDMTFVGPRPEMLKNVEEYTEELPEFEYRLRVKAGVTGYAQIAGKYNTTPKDKLIMDMMYIEQFSILRDIQLIFQTAIVLLKSDSTEAFDESMRQHPYKFIPAEQEEKTC